MFRRTVMERATSSHAAPAPAVRSVKPAVDPQPESSPTSPSLNSLPTDLVAEIFSHTPFRARLVTLSLVCKRFRSAALRSIDSVILPPGRGGPLISHATAAAFLALVPSLKLKTISAEHSPVFMFPSDALQSLSLGETPLRLAWELEGQGVRTFLSAHFPHLRSLKLRLIRDGSGSATSFSRFLARHTAQLTHLHIIDHGGDCFPLQQAISALDWSALKELIMECSDGAPLDFGRFVAAMQTSATLHLTTPANVFNVIPTERLANLVHWHNVDELDSDVDLARLKSLPRLRSIACLASDLPDMESKITSWWIQDSPAEVAELAHLSNLETLHWEMKISYKDRIPVLPKLTTLMVGNPSFWELEDIVWGLGLACAFLRTQPLLRNITIYVATQHERESASDDEDSDDSDDYHGVRPALRELADLAYKNNVAITLCGAHARKLVKSVPQARRGWLIMHAVNDEDS